MKKEGKGRKREEEKKKEEKEEEFENFTTFSGRKKLRPCCDLTNCDQVATDFSALRLRPEHGQTSNYFYDLRPRELNNLRLRPGGQVVVAAALCAGFGNR